MSQNKLADEFDMTHWREMFENDYQGGWSLKENQEATYTISFVEQRLLSLPGGAQSEKPVIVFKDNDVLPMVLNKTNAKVLEDLYGPFIQAWNNKRVTIVGVMTKLGRKMVPSLRVKPKVPTDSKPRLHPEHPRWGEALRNLIEEKVSLDWIKKNFDLDEGNEFILVDAVNEARGNSNAEA